jgi:ribosomal protein S18 acetylase RimI-like enzyme
MQITARDATEQDLAALIDLYEALADEQSALRPLWREAEGVADPAARSLAGLIADGAVTVGTIDGVVLGFLVSGERTTVDGDGRIGLIRYLYSDPEARGVGLGDAMFGHAVAALRATGIESFDAIVSPGHREAKNFYEAHGFSARSIVMHSDDPVLGQE